MKNALSEEAAAALLPQARLCRQCWPHPVEAAATAPRKPGAHGKDHDVALGMTDARPARHVPGLLPRQSSTSRGHLVPS